MTSKDFEQSATSGMEGRGYYNRHSELQNVGIAHQRDRLISAVARIPLTHDELRIVDYGCGPGRNSVAELDGILSALRARAPQVSLVATHNDLIGNDWSDLVAQLRGPESYLDQVPETRVELSIGSFFEQVASEGSVDLGVSFGAVHWLSRYIGVSAPGSLFFCDVPEPARAEIAAQAASDWHAFLANRGRELKPGGMLIVDMLGSAPDENDPSGLSAAGRGLYRAMWQVADVMVSDGSLDQGALRDFVFPVVFPTEAQVRAPLGGAGPIAKAFDIVDITVEDLPNPQLETLARDGDREAYGRGYAGFARAFSESTLRRHLFSPSATSLEAEDGLTDRFFELLQKLFAAEPERFAFEHKVLTTVLQRTSDMSDVEPSKQ